MFGQTFPALSSNYSRTTRMLRTHWTMGIGLGIALAACGSDEGGPGTDTEGSGGSVSSGGTSASTGGTGGGNGTTTGGTGGTADATGGGSSADGGSDTGGGSSADGGSDTGGGSSADGGSGGSGTGGSGTETCEIGTTQGNEVLFIGESFVAASSIPQEVTNLARAAGRLASNDSYEDRSVSGTWIGNGAANSIPNQYRNNSDGVRFVLMNGGGNDCWQGGQESHRTAALNAASELFEDMAENGVEKIVYFFYPDPIGSQYANLTACLNLLRPEMKALCDAQVSPQCYWVDLRETWDGHPEYTSDGIHVAGPGNAPTAAAIFESMVDNCVAP